MIQRTGWVQRVFTTTGATQRRDDPIGVPDLFVWRRILQDRAPDPYREMMEDLKRVMRRAAP